MMRSLLVAMLCLGACADPKERLEPPKTVAEQPRYWLRRQSDAVPRLVEVADGHIFDPDEPSWRLPWSWPEKPEEGQGLMLYAQRTVLLLSEAGGKPSNVTLYPGAFVAVVPTQGGYLVAPGPPASGSVLFAEEDVLGTALVAPVADADPPTQARASRCWFNAPDNPEPCVPLLLGPEENQVTQRVGLVETRGEMSTGFAHCHQQPVRPMQVYCLASVVSRSSTGFRLANQAIPTVPDGYREIATGETVLARWLQEPKGSIYVMVWQDEAIRCAPITFKAHASDDGMDGEFHEPLNGRHLPFRYRAPAAYRVATLAVLDVGGCGLADIVFVVGSLADEAHVLRGPVGSDARFYLESEAERWFATASRCEAAATEARTRLDADQRLMLSLGLHGPFSYRGSLDVYEEN